MCAEKAVGMEQLNKSITIKFNTPLFSFVVHTRNSRTLTLKWFNVGIDLKLSLVDIVCFCPLRINVSLTNLKTCLLERFPRPRSTDIVRLCLLRIVVSLKVFKTRLLERGFTCLGLIRNALFCLLCTIISLTVFKTCLLERDFHAFRPYKECFVFLSKRRGISQSAPIGASILTGTLARCLALLIPFVTVQTHF